MRSALRAMWAVIGWRASVPSVTLACILLHGCSGPPQSTTTDHQPILASVYGFFSNTYPEAADYGRYTYVVLPEKSARNTSFLQALLRSTPPEAAAAAPKVQLNVFELPVTAGYAPEDLSYSFQYPAEQSAQKLAGLAAKAYDYGEARHLLRLLCAGSAPRRAKICSSPLKSGPYLLTFPTPISKVKEFSPPYLVVDLSAMSEAAFGYFITRMKEQVRLGDITDRSRIEATHARVMSLGVSLLKNLPGDARKIVDASEIIETKEK